MDDIIDLLGYLQPVSLLIGTIIFLPFNFKSDLSEYMSGLPSEVNVNIRVVNTMAQEYWRRQKRLPNTRISKGASKRPHHAFQESVCFAAS